MRDDKPDGCEEERLETIQVALRVIVSFDVDARRPGVGVTIDRYVHGRKVTVRLKDRKKSYFYPGLISRPGVEKLGQSVLLMKERDAEDFHALLARLKVPHRQKRVWLRPIDLA